LIDSKENPGAISPFLSYYESDRDNRDKKEGKVKISLASLLPDPKRDRREDTSPDKEKKGRGD
jgi:hypothetical protein